MWAELDGYYLDDYVPADVVPGEERTVTLMMKRTIRINGVAHLPAGFAAEKALAILDHRRTAEIAADGSFSFDNG